MNTDRNSGLGESPLVPRLVLNSRSRRGDPQNNIGGGIDRTGISPSSGVGTGGGGSGGQASGPGGGGGSGLGNGSSQGGANNDFNNRIGDLENMVNNASISAECNGDGTITVTLTWGE